MNIRKAKSKFRIVCVVVICNLSCTNAHVGTKTPVDADADQVADFIDNCVMVANSDQRDTDADGIGNMCDADFDNNGIVDEKDTSQFAKRFGSDDPDADFNGDGTVDKSDREIFEELLFLEQPGPSNTVGEPTFVLAPPPAFGVDLYRVYPTRIDGKNAALMVGYEDVEGLPPVIGINLANETVALNDQGLLADQKAGDNIYSAFLSFDFSGQIEDETSFRKRATSSQATRVVDFSGRSVVETRSFDLPIPEGPGALNEQVELRDGTLLEPFVPALDHLPILPRSHDPSRSLIITDPAVVADPLRTYDPCDSDGDGNRGNVDGVWSFKTLLSNMAPRGQEREFIHQWLQQWLIVQTVNGFSTSSNPRALLKDFFIGWDGVNASTLDIDSLPFRLLAIVNRIDLAKSSAYGASASSGEIRLVFGILIDSSPGCSSPSPDEMTVIFEYKDETTDNCAGLKSRANQWLRLSALVPGSPGFNTALQDITDDVTQRNSAPSRPGGSALGQLRTNEIVNRNPWTLREFVIDSGSGNLATTTVKQTPDQIFRLTSRETTDSFVVSQAPEILCEAHVVPESFESNPFLTSEIFNPAGDNFWKPSPDPSRLPARFPFCHRSNAVLGSPGIQNELRHKFGLNTCNGCHSVAETGSEFVHVDPMTFPSELSGFLTGTVVIDPIVDTIAREFNDLLRRSQILEELATKSCFSISLPREFDPLVISPRTNPVFGFEPRPGDPRRVSFWRAQQSHTFVH